MSKMIQIRNVPEKVHRALKSRAAMKGKTMSDYLLGVVEKELASPDIEEFLKRIRSIPPDTSGFNATEYIRRERDAR
ncbi:MAG: hypothetical protein FJW38_18160 [Acidobacteria bacterium]|nr:hypothetical protein [Acidobacteriota bacterium]